MHRGVPAFLILLGACVAPEGPADLADPGKDDGWGAATIVLADDWTESVQGTLRAGAPLRLRYDADRLGGCRGDQGGVPQWSITAYASVDGGAWTAIGLRGTGDVVEGTFAALPGGRDLALYFTVHNRWGCIAYDSEFGGNYHFAIDPPPAASARLRFHADGDVELDGDLVAGGTLVVEYDPARDTTCRGTQGGIPQWSVTGFVQVDDAPPTTFDPTVVDGDDRAIDPTTLVVPHGEWLELWFQHTNRWGCSAYDSDAGANFGYAITR